MTARNVATIVPVGGFLGAGKTRLLLRAAALLKETGVRAAIITNDQGENLVDSHWATDAGVSVGEVSGGCFCCRFDDFFNAANLLLEQNIDVIFAEPVGSCADLSATVIQPLKALHGNRFRLAPLTVLADPQRAKDLLQEENSDLTYLFSKQLEEADLVCFSKSDLGVVPPALSISAPVRQLSAKTGEGVSAWLDEVLNGKLTSGGQLLDIDYQRYAQAEAALGWVNWHATTHLDEAREPVAVVGPLLDDIEETLTKIGCRIVHLKISDDAGTGFLKAAICRNAQYPEIEGDLTASPADRHELIVNLRAEAEPEVLKGALEPLFNRVPGTVVLHKFEVFQPSAPVPQHRYSELVATPLTHDQIG